jgi:hypothetical protein
MVVLDELLVEAHPPQLVHFEGLGKESSFVADFLWGEFINPLKRKLPPINH